MRRYNPKEIEPKWQKIWRRSHLYKVDMSRTSDKFYAIPFLPYPSGDLHIGHWYNYTGADVVARWHRMLGQNVFTTIGFDAFGLPAENAAIQRAIQPAIWTKDNIKSMTEQLGKIGASYDWSHCLATCDPEYYRWNQWLFLQLYKKGLAYRAKALVNWCPKDQTVLANEQVVGEKNVCERCGTPVIQKELEQWFFKITDYAERLLTDLESVDWPERVKTMQVNWIGKSQGAQISFGLSTADNFVLLHGFEGSSRSNFFPWIKQQLEAAGGRVYVPDMPNTAQPDAKEQAKYVLKNANFDERTVLLGHSYGSVTALRVVEQLPKPIKKLVLVAGFAQPGFKDRQRDFEETTDWEFDFTKIKNNVAEIVILRPANDSPVPPERADYLQQKLGGRIIDFTAEADHATGKREPVVLENLGGAIRVFTTRPDTIFGATYMVLAPEHPLVNSLTTAGQKAEMTRYIAAAERKSELERKAAEKDKTGVFSGSYAINPANGEKIPIWVADYVLMNYGTGAIMAVPAHDERDYQFAQKYELAIKQVVAPYLIYEGKHKARDGIETLKRHVVDAIIKNQKDEYLLIFENDDYHFVGGGADPGEDDIAAIIREVAEEVGFTDIAEIKEVSATTIAYGYRANKNKNQIVDGKFYEVTLNSDKRIKSEVDEGAHTLHWVSKEEVGSMLSWGGHKTGWKQYTAESTCYDGEGTLINSDNYDGLSSAEAREQIVADLAKKGIAKEETQFRLRDWLISRQRYWGTPIPIVYCAEHGAVALDEKDLPLILPEDVEFTPTGRNPLLERRDFVDAKCPKCGRPAKRETDTMDTFVDSSWYYLRYLDNKNDRAIFETELVNKWAPVDHYIGGIEHAILHLLYARFITKFFHDNYGVEFTEPFKKLTNNGIIAGPDGQKMSKSRGNVVNPDEQVESYGADSLRLYLMFMGPFEQGGPYNLGGIAGTRRFLDRLWVLVNDFVEAEAAPESHVEEAALQAAVHRTIKKVTKDVEDLNFNTAIAAMMSVVNELYKFKADKGVYQSPGWQSVIEILVQLLAPFAPHIAEEMWQLLGHETSVHLSNWPLWDEKLVAVETFTMAIQVNGRLRGEVEVPQGSSQEEAEKLAKEEPKISAQLAGKTITKTIYVPERLINFVLS